MSEVQPVKRKRGRPRKNPLPVEPTPPPDPPPVTVEVSAPEIREALIVRVCKHFGLELKDVVEYERGRIIKASDGVVRRIPPGLEA